MTAPELLALSDGEKPREPVKITVRWGHVGKMPTCEHGRIEGFCDCWDKPKDSPADDRGSRIDP